MSPIFRKTKARFLYEQCIFYCFPNSRMFVGNTAIEYLKYRMVMFLITLQYVPHVPVAIGRHKFW